MNKLFEIPTTVSAESDGTNLVEVRITTSKEVRSKIWHIIVQNDFNPAVAQFGLKGDSPTTIILRPYSGYEESGLVAQMAYAAACLAQVEDFTLLFDDPSGSGPAVLENLPEVIGFEINGGTIYELQKLYVSYMARETLQSLAHELSSLSIDYEAFRNWRAEAEDALRRLRFSGKKLNPGEYLALTNAAKLVNRYAEEAASIRRIQDIADRDLRQKIDSFATKIKDYGPIPNLVSKYYDLLAAVLTEHRIRRESVDSLVKSRKEIREAMGVIRANTPPVPPAPKK